MQTKIAPKILPRIISLLLVLVTIFTLLPTTAFADEYNGEGGGSSGGSVNQGGTWDEAYQGYRMTIVTEQGWVVGSPVDFLYSELPANTEALYDSKVESTGSRKTRNPRYRIDWMHKTGELKDAPEMTPKAVLWGAYGPGGTKGSLGNGQKLRNWMIGNNSTIQGDFNSENGWIKMLLNYHLDGKFIFKFPAKYDKYDNVPKVGADGRFINGRTEIMAENKFVMLIEPLLWFQPRNKAKTKTYPKFVYGTLTNHADWSLLAEKNGTFDDNKMYWMSSVIRVSGAWSLHLSKNEDFINRPATWTIHAPTASIGSRVSREEVANSNIGLALHVYRIGDLTPSEPGFPTWGEGPIPEPAPDPKTLTGLPKPDPSKPETAYKYNVVKTYRDKTFNEEGNEEIKHVGTFSRTETPGKVIIQDEPNYKVKEWFISSTYNNPTGSTTWEDNHSQAPITGSTGKGTGTAEIKKPNTTLYVLLEKQEKKPLPPGEGDLVIEESQVTKAVETMTSSVTGWGPQTMTFKANDISGACPYIFYHSCEDCSYSWQCSAPYVLNDRAWNYNHKNTTPIDSKIHADGGVFKPINDRGTDAKGERDTVSEYTNFVDTFNYKLVVWRGEDVPTIANYKEQSSNPLNTLVKRYGKEPAGQRYSPYSGKGLSYNRDLLITLDKDGGLGDYTTTSVTDHGYSKSATHANINTLNYDTQSTVKVYYGKAHEKGNLTAAGTQAFTTTLVGKPSAPKYSGGQMKQSGEVTWYPYIRMTYQTTGVKDPTRTNVNILSQYISELTPNDYVEAAWVSTKDYNMNLKSAQWSLHSA